MLSSHDPVTRPVSEFVWQTKPGLIRGPPQSQREWNAVEQVWGDAFLHFDARVRIIMARTLEYGSRPSNLASAWSIACLSDVRHAIYELHMWIVYEGVSLAAEAPAIVSYLSEAYVWCGDVLDDVEALLEDLRTGSTYRDPALAKDSDSYVEEFLCPLLGRVCESSRTGGPAPTYLALRPLVERLHVAIVSLNWALIAS